MSNKHKKIINYYSNPKNIFFIQEDIYEIRKEKSLNELFGIDSYKEPDLVYFCKDNIYIGEVKSRLSFRSSNRAREQVMEYYNILKENNIDTVPFVVLEFYVRFL